MSDLSMSSRLYQYLSHIVGNKKVVMTRRAFFHVFDLIMSRNCSERFDRILSSGSKAEGLNFSSSDLDVMFLFHNTVHGSSDSRNQCHDANSLFIDTDNTPAGFAHIKVLNFEPKMAKRDDICKKDIAFFENKMILRNSRYKELQENDSLVNFFLPVHGPCLSTKDEDFDFLTCFRCDSWPTVAAGWFKRVRSSEWPQVSVMSNIVAEDVLLVPIGSKFGSSTENCFEWRISFSIAEKLLVYSINHTQLICYALMKLVLKEVINKQTNTNNILCSYFMKTTLFWTLEETGYSGWTPNNILSGFQKCLRKLVYFLRLGCCPNYFIPECNLFAGKISANSQRNLINLLEDVINSGCLFTLNCVSLQKFLECKVPPRSQYTVNDDIEAIKSLVGYIDYFAFLFEKNTLLLHHKILQILSAGHISILCTKMFYLWFVRLLFCFGCHVTHNYETKNKRFYKSFRRNTSYAVLGTNRDGLGGLIWLAAYFYQHKQYVTSLQIIHFTSLKYSFKMNYGSRLGRMSFYESLRSLSTDFAFGFISPGSVLYGSELMPLHAYSISLYLFAFTWRSFGLFIAFMCHHKLGNIAERDTCLHSLVYMLKGEIPSKRLVNLIYVLRAYDFSNRIIPIGLFLQVLPTEFIKNVFANPRYLSMVKAIMGKDAEYVDYALWAAKNWLGIPVCTPEEVDAGQMSGSDIMVPGIKLKNAFEDSYLK